MTLEWLVFRALVSLAPPWGQREPEVSRWERLHGVARAIADEARQVPGRELETAALLGAVGTHESRWSRAVGPGACDRSVLGRHACDRGRARSYYQLWSVACPRLFSRLARGQLAVATSCASRLLWGAAEACAAGAPLTSRRAIVGALSRYAVGHGCSWRGADERFRTYQRLLRRLRREAA